MYIHNDLGASGDFNKDPNPSLIEYSTPINPITNLSAVGVRTIGPIRVSATSLPDVSSPVDASRQTGERAHELVLMLTDGMAETRHQ